MDHSPSTMPPLHRGRVLPRDAVRLLDDPIVIGDLMDDDSAVSCSLIREAGIIRSIRLQCPCGQVIILECDYRTDSPTAGEDGGMTPDHERKDTL